MSVLDIKWKLKACRIQAGYTQREVAEYLGVSDVSIRNWEKGKTAPKMEQAEVLSNLYEIPLMCMDFTKEGNRGAIM